MYLAHLEKLSRIRLADVLVEEGVLERDRVEEAQAEQEETGRKLGDILVEREILSEFDLAKLIATRYTLPYLDVAGYQAKREVLARLPMDFCEKHTLLPLDEFGSMFTIAVTEMPDPELVQTIVSHTKMIPCLFVALRRGILNVLAEEKKRGGKHQAAKSGAKPAAEAAAAAKPAAPPAAQAAAGGGQKPDLPLPEFDLPIVSMKLVGATAAKVAAAPQRVSSVKEVPAAGKPGGALSWMDTAGGTGSATDPTRPKISKFGAAPTPKTEPAPAAKPAPGAGANAAPPKPAVGPSAPAKPAGASGAWQSIFDVAEEAVRKTK